MGGWRARLATAIVCVLVAATVPGGVLGGHDRSGVAVEEDRAKALFDGGIPDDIEVWAAERGALVVLAEPHLDLVAFDIHSRTNGSAFLEELRERSDVRWAGFDVRLQASASPDDPAYEDQYGPRMIDAPEAWAIQRGSADVRVAILDAGVDALHADLEANCGDCGADAYGHGTAVAGVIGAGLDNGRHIAGLAQVELVSQHALGDSGSGYASRVAAEIVQAAEAGADIVALPLAGQCDLADLDLCPELRDAVEHAWQRDVVLVGAAGNHGRDHGVLEPAAVDEVLAVGSVGPDADRSGFSNGGPALDLVAPGEGIVSTAPPASSLCGTQPDGLCTLTGTSVATAHVVGVAALLRSECSPTNAQVVEAITVSAEDVGEVGWDASHGHGLVDADDALAHAC